MTDIKAALARGDTEIRLEPGTYSGAQIKGRKTLLVIRSADPANKAVFTDLLVKDSAEITIADVEFDLTGKKANPFTVLQSSDVRIEGVRVHGSLNDDPQDDPATGLLVRDSRNVTVTGCEFEQLFHGLSHLDSNGLTITANSFHDLRTDGIRGGGSSNVTIDGNKFTDFYPISGDHPDAIQFWTTNTTAPVRKITVTKNEIVRGKGAPMQGVFFRDNQGLPFEDVTITDNIVVGGLYNGVTMESGTNVTVENNVVVPLPDQGSRFDFRKVKGRLANNRGTHFLLTASEMVQDRNEKIEAATDDGTAALAKWRVSPKEPHVPSEIRIDLKPGQVLVVTGVQA